MSTVDWTAPVLVALTAYGAFNLVVTCSLIRDDSLDAAQKVAQILIIWLVPFIGGGIILAFQGHHHPRQEMKSLVPFPFYLVGYSERNDKMVADRYSHDNGVEGFDCSAGEGSSGSD